MARLSSEDTITDEAATSRILSERESTTLAALCEAFLPRLEPLKGDDAGLYGTGALERGVVFRVEDTLSDVSEQQQREFRFFLRLLDNGAFVGIHGGRPARFSTLPIEQRERVLRALGSSMIPGIRSAFQATRRLATFHFYAGANGASPDPVWSAIGYEPSANRPAESRPLELTRITRDSVVEADVCVIGSGAGGSVAAAQLAASGLSVLVMEAGSDWQSEDFDQREGPGTRELYLDRGTAATRDLSISMLAGSAIGGGTAVNWQTCLRTPDDVRAEWAEQSGCGSFGEDVFTHSLDAVCERLSVGTRESSANPNNAVLRDGCAALGYQWSVPPRNSAGCDLAQCGYCVYGCRHGGKQSGAVTWLRDAQALGHTRVIAKCAAERIVIESGRATGVVAHALGEDERRYAVTVKARIVVAACGALHSPALLSRSGVRLPQLGRNLHVHPTTGISALFEDRIAAWEGPPQTMLCTEFARLRDGYGFRIETAPAHPGLLAAALPWTGGRAHRDQMASAARKALLIILVRDRTTGVVSVNRNGRPVVDYRPGTGERQMLREGMTRSARILRAAGAIGLQTLHTNPISMGEGSRDGRRASDVDAMCSAILRSETAENHLGLFSAHQMGTCRMGRDALTAVCDERGAVFGVKGLYVADASLFPASSGVNPMITIMAVAHQVAGGIT